MIYKNNDLLGSKVMYCNSKDISSWRCGALCKIPVPRMQQAEVARAKC